MMFDNYKTLRKFRKITNDFRCDDNEFHDFKGIKFSRLYHSGKVAESIESLFHYYDHNSTLYINDICLSRDVQNEIMKNGSQVLRLIREWVKVNYDIPKGYYISFGYYCGISRLQF